MRKQGFGCIAVVTVGIVLLGWIIWGMIAQNVDAGYVGVMYSARAGSNTENGLVVNPDKSVKLYRPGRHWVPPMHELYTFPTKPQLALYTQDPTLGELKQADGVRITTSDTASTVFDIGVLYGVEPEDLGTVFANFGKTDIQTIQRSHIRRALQDAANDIGPLYDAQTLIAPALEEAGQKLTHNLKEKLESKKITIHEAFFLRPYPDGNIQTKINQRINIITGAEIARIHKEKAEIERKTSIITASAQAKARALTAAGSQAKSIEMMSLEVDEAAIAAWSGNFPTVPAGKGISVVLGQGAAPHVAIAGGN